MLNKYLSNKFSSSPERILNSIELSQLSRPLPYMQCSLLTSCWFLHPLFTTTPFCRWRNWGPERQRELSQTTGSGRGRARPARAGHLSASRTAQPPRSSIRLRAELHSWGSKFHVPRVDRNPQLAQTLCPVHPPETSQVLWANSRCHFSEPPSFLPIARSGPYVPQREKAPSRWQRRGFSNLEGTTRA